jgi:hypothetical protein
MQARSAAKREAAQFIADEAPPGKSDACAEWSVFADSSGYSCTSVALWTMDTVVQTSATPCAAGGSFRATGDRPVKKFASLLMVMLLAAACRDAAARKSLPPMKERQATCRLP